MAGTFRYIKYMLCFRAIKQHREIFYYLLVCSTSKGIKLAPNSGKEIFAKVYFFSIKNVMYHKIMVSLR